MDLNQISAETLESIKKAQTAGVTSSTGIFGVDLTGLISLIPVNTPFYNSVAKTTAEQGAKFATWRALVNVNNTQPDPAIAFDQAGNVVNLDELDAGAAYGAVAAGYTVSRDSIALAKGYADAKAVAVFNALNQYKIAMDRKLLGGQSFALQAPTGLAVVASSTGGSIAASTAVPVQVAARTQSNYFWGGSTAATAQVSVTTGTGSSNSATATVGAVRGAVAYDWFVNGFYYTTTTVNKVVVTSIPTANQSVPSLPGIYGTAPSSVPTSDSSAKPYDFNGLLATLAGDYATGGAFGQVTHGSGTPSGAVFQSLDGGTFTISGANIAELDNLNESIYANVQLSPTRYLVSSQTGSEISSGLLGTAAGATTFFQPNVLGERTSAIAGAHVGSYVNKADGGSEIRIEIQPNLAPGTLIAVTDRVPFPNSNITNTLEQRDVEPVYDYEYGSARIAGSNGGPRQDGETRSLSTLVNRAPVAMGVLQNIG